MRAFYEKNNMDNVKIGRVLTIKHGNGIGKKLLEESLEEIKNKLKCKKMTIHAQKYAVGFYEKFGFKVVFDEFIEEGIVHVKMELEE